MTISSRLFSAWAFFIFLGGGGLKFAVDCNKRFRRGRYT